MIIRKPIEAEFEFQDAHFTIRQLTPGQRMEAGDISLKKRIEYRMADEIREAVRVIESDAGAERVFVVKKVLVSWKNVFDAEGKDLECTDENKLALLDAVEGFYAFIIEKLDELDKTADAESKAIEKNS